MKNLDQFKCGACGCGLYKIYRDTNGDIITQCMNTECGCVSRISIKSDFKVDSDPNEPGTMCLGWSEKIKSQYYYQSKNTRGWVNATTDQQAMLKFSGWRTVSVWRVSKDGTKTLILRKKGVK